ncbi:MAG: glycerophosphodiester phosphodiesterase family protein [Gaiellales bacterium]
MTYLIAHRGLPRNHRENSLEAIAAALEHGPIIEIDVRSTSDAVPVCAHDASLDRTHGIRSKIGQLDKSELHEHAPDVPTLADVLDLIADHDGAVMLDVKVSRPRAIEAIEQVVAASRISWNDGRAIRRGEPLAAGTATFQAGDAQLLQAFRARTGAGTLELIRGISSARELILGAPFITAYAQGVTIPDGLATRGMLRMLRRLKLGTYVYTINTQARYEELTLAGASAIYTDVIDTLGAIG